jgi:hypothetical protein
MPQILTRPTQGAMYMFDYATPPLQPDSYKLAVQTDVRFDGHSHPLDDARYFEIVGPRFSLPASDVAGVFPPRNAQGPFEDALAQIVIKRRTLPWERTLDKTNLIGAPTSPGLPAQYPMPWLALLLFEEGECTLLENTPLENVVPAEVFTRLGRPTNVLCTAVEADKSLVLDIMPSKEELALLSHVRWVNIDDRELNVEGSDGWFSVVVANRLPSRGAKCRACLVSLEERTDLVKKDPPPSFVPIIFVPITIEAEFRDVRYIEADRNRVVDRQVDAQAGRLTVVAPVKTRLVVLHTWQFTSAGPGTFFTLMQGLDVGMIGKVKKEGEPALTDTAHLRVEMQERGGENETVWYRGPLVPFELTRDPLGPYHSADQARRATPETGAEDVSYAAAFEVGRLLAASDARLAQELMRWRREAYKQSGRLDNVADVESVFQLDLPVAVADRAHSPFVPILATATLEKIVSNAGPIADRYGVVAASKAVGMNPEIVQATYSLGSIQEAQALLGGDPATLGAEVSAPKMTPRPNVTLETVLADTASLDALTQARDRVIENVKTKLGG